MDFIFFLLILGIFIFILVGVLKLNDILNQLKIFQKGEVDLSKQLKHLYEMGLFSQSELIDKLQQFKQKENQEGKKQEPREYLENLYESGLLTNEELKRKEKKLTKLENQMDEVQDLQKHTGDDDIAFFAEEKANSWLCVCGTENGLEQNNCESCKRNKQFVLENYSRTSAERE